MNDIDDIKEVSRSTNEAIQMVRFVGHDLVLPQATIQAAQAHVLAEKICNMQRTKS